MKRRRFVLPETVDRPSIPCPCCRGTGKVALANVYLETLVLLSRQTQEVNGAALAKLAGCKATAMNNRLVRLKKLGLVSDRVNGRERLWTPIPIPMRRFL